MEHQYKVQKLADFLVDMGLEREACELLSLFKKKALIKPPEVNDWYQVIEEIEAPYVDTAYQAVSRYLHSASSHLKKASEGLIDATPEDIKQIVNTVPLESLVSQALKRNNLLKYASVNSEDSLIKVAEFCVKSRLIEQPDYKKANWWKYVKMIGGGVVKYLLPFVSLIFALINFYYCAIEFSKLMSEIPEAGLSWYDPLRPQALTRAVEENSDDPSSLKKIAKASKTSKIFVDEFISLAANSIDGIKDIIFLVANIASGGLAIAIDLGISFLLMCAEWSAEGATLPLYDKVIFLIKDIATRNIKEHYLSDFKNKMKEFEEIPDIAPQISSINETTSV